MKNISPRTFNGLQNIGFPCCFGTSLYYLEPLVDSKQVCHYSISSYSSRIHSSDT